MDEANRLSVGPMGFSGRTTLIGCKIGALNRLPASFFVSIAYDCWAFRRLGVHLDAAHRRDHVMAVSRSGGAVGADAVAGAVAAGFPRTGREIALQAPISEEQIRALKVGDVVLISGRVYTGRDAVHAHLMKHEPPVDLRGGVLYHCGPVVAKEGDGWRITAAGPTTSIREEPYQAEILEALRRARGDREGRDGGEDAGRPAGIRRGLSERHRRRRAVLRALHRAGRRRVADSSSARPRRCGTCRSAIFPPS